MRSILQISLVLLILFVTIPCYSSDLVPLYPKYGTLSANRDNHRPPGYGGQTDILYPVQHVDEIAEYYLGSGALDDTFFVVFEPPCACSVKYAEFQWYDVGNITAFAAWYSDAATAMYPLGQAPNRGTSPVSPLGQWIAGPMLNTTSSSGDWQVLDLGNVEFVCGNPQTMESDMFGVGFIKGAADPHPLADAMDPKGIRYTYTWFGGPWMSTYTYDWGAYSVNLTAGTVIEVMARVWVSYPWGMPIQISDLSQYCNTFGTAGPYRITCVLEDDNGISAADEILLKYQVNAGTAIDIDLTQMAPGSDIYYADIPGQPVGSVINYWIETVDDAGFESQCAPKNFEILEPDNPAAELFFIGDGLTADRAAAYFQTLDTLGVTYEYWDAEVNNGIDAATVNFGWDNVMVVAWGTETVKALDDSNPYSAYISAGGNFCLIDQDYFFANGLPVQGTFAPGDFAYDYLGIGEYHNDPGDCDINYLGIAADPISFTYENSPYETYWDETGQHMFTSQCWTDYMEAGLGEEIFIGEEDGYSYGVRYQGAGFKTVFLSFMAEANCSFNQITGDMNASFELITLIENIMNWFGVETDLWGTQVFVNLTPHNPPIIIPAYGGSFQFDFNLLNQGEIDAVVDVRTEIKLNSGNIYELIQRQNITIPGGAQLSKPNITQNAPAAAHQGFYLYYAYVEDHVTSYIYDFDYFLIVKQPVDSPGAEKIQNWNVLGWEEDNIEVTIIPLKFSVSAPSPNPFNPETNLTIELPLSGEVTISVFNIEGKQVDTIFSGFTDAGTHDYTWNASQFSSGIYFCRIQTPCGEKLTRLLLLK